MTEMSIDTVIVGQGISGLACARRLHQKNLPFVLITDRLGGRMHASRDFKVNYGASYITSDYRHTSRFIGKREPIRMREACFLDGDRWISIFDRRNISRLRQIVTLYGHLYRFRRHLNRLRAQAAERCQRQLLEEDQFLLRTVRQDAVEFIRANRLEEINEVFLDPILNSTVFVSHERVNTFYYLAVLMPILLPTYVADFSETVPRLIEGWKDRIIIDKVVAITRRRNGEYQVQAQHGRYTARACVVSTPCHNTREFIPEGLNHGPAPLQVPISVLYVSGRRKASLPAGKILFFRPDHDVTVLWPQGDAHDLLFSKSKTPDLGAYYDHCDIESAVHWKTAVMLSRQWRHLEPEDSLFMVGDHNICGLEDSYLTGLYAANRIIAARRGSRAAPAGLHHAIHLPAAVHRVAGEMSIEATASHDGGADAGKLGTGTREVEIRDRRLEGRPAEIDVPRA